MIEEAYKHGCSAALARFKLSAAVSVSTPSMPTMSAPTASTVSASTTPGAQLGMTTPTHSTAPPAAMDAAKARPLG